jgi:hypothetical protein
MNRDERSLNHFLDLALKGKRIGDSSGARAARRIALTILENAPVLDGEAVEGLCLFVHLVKAKPQSSRNLVK